MLKSLSGRSTARPQGAGAIDLLRDRDSRLPTALGCAPSVNVLGVYFPGWLVSALAGIVVASALVWWLGRRPGQLALAQSGLFFCSLTVAIGLLTWWVFFRGF